MSKLVRLSKKEIRELTDFRRSQTLSINPSAKFRPHHINYDMPCKYSVKGASHNCPIAALTEIQAKDLLAEMIKDNEKVVKTLEALGYRIEQALDSLP